MKLLPDPRAYSNWQDWAAALRRELQRGDDNRLPILPTYTVSGLPPVVETGLIYVSNASGGGIPCFSDGTNWRRVDTRAVAT